MNVLHFSKTNFTLVCHIIYVTFQCRATTVSSLNGTVLHVYIVDTFVNAANFV